MEENWRLIHYKVMAEGIKAAFYEGIRQFSEGYPDERFYETLWNSSTAKYEHDLLMDRYNAG